MKIARKGMMLSLGAAAVAFGAAGLTSDNTYAYEHTITIPDAGLFECLTTEGNLRTNPGAQIVNVPVVNATDHILAADEIDSTNSFMVLDCSNHESGYGIKDISGLTLFPEASHLQMEKINNINFAYNDISSISTLSGHNYVTINLAANKVTDISSLKNSTTLLYLNITSNNLGNGATSTLQSLTSLKYLAMGATNISNLSFVSSLPNLTNLYAFSNGISDYSPLASRTGLQELTLSWNDSTDISPLANLTNLTDLRLAGLGLTNNSYQYLKNLTNVEKLDLSMNELTNIQGLGALSNLTNLNVALNHIEDFSGVPTSITYEGTTPTDVYGQTVTIEAGAATSVKAPAAVAQFMSSQYAQFFKVETWGGSYNIEDNTINLDDDADVVTVRLSPKDSENAVITSYDPEHPYYLEITITRTSETTDNPDTGAGISTTASIFGGLIAAIGAIFTIKRARR